MSVVANKFCRRSDLTNEASVEQFFVSRLLLDLGYKDEQIKPKTSLDALTVSLGSRRLKYKPDYAIVIGGKVRWIVEAKAPSESLADHIEQCSGYCLSINRQDEEQPAKFFMITNGNATEVYAWDKGTPILTIAFADFTDQSVLLGQLRSGLSSAAFGRRPRATAARSTTHVLRRRTIEDVNSDFAWCHQFIHRKDALSQSAAFLEFVKLVFLKLMSDRAVRAIHPDTDAAAELVVPASEVRFSTSWLDARKDDAANPIDALQFQELLKDQEKEIKAGSRKRIFDAGASILLRPDTIRGVVSRLEHTDLYSIDADLNGRLFETFLNATMRGKDLGQFFTPRSVVKLAVRLAAIQVGREHTDTVIDACCGSGGFLIDALSDMWRKVETNASMSNKERAALKKLIATTRLVGIDVAADPPLARIARMNMYLHGDGGSRVYQADALDKGLAADKSDTAELASEKAELARLITADGGCADVVLTNPPFAKEYNRKDGDGPTLDAYEMAFASDGGARKPRPSLKSSIMFLERYHNMLRSKPTPGRMITVIDDSILGSRDYRHVREFIRQKFIVRAVVSPPGDAFQRSNARVKTSVLYLVKRRDSTEEQPPVFMHYCTIVGLDDPSRQRVLPIDTVNRERAKEEVQAIGELFEAFMKGDRAAEKWMVPASAIKDRLDVKHCLLRPGRLLPKWKRGDGCAALGDLVRVRWPLPDDAGDAAREDVVEADTADGDLRYLRVRYDGFAEAGEDLPTDGDGQFFKVRAGDVVISHINAVNGAVAIVPVELDGAVVTNEFTVCRAKDGVDPRLVWSLLRTQEARSDLLILATGIGRTRVKTEQALKLDVPTVGADVADPLVKDLQRAERLEEEARRLRQEAREKFEAHFGLANQKAAEIIAAFKPPR